MEFRELRKASITSVIEDLNHWRLWRTDSVLFCYNLEGSNFQCKAHGQRTISVRKKNCFSMASFRPTFQIPRAASVKGFSIHSATNIAEEHRNPQQFLKVSSSVQTVLKENVRFFWSRKSTDQPVQRGPGNCGKPLPIPVDLVCKHCPPKCPKSTSKKCEKHEGKTKSKGESAAEKLTWWEKIFGPSPKRQWPDPCSCRVAHRQRQNMREQDPRLLDQRYKTTVGDVLIYTETIKSNERCPVEPQPKSPPDYIVPKAALVKMLNRLRDPPSVANISLNSKSPDCMKRTGLMSYRIPYEEMRPPLIRRKSFNCYEGVPPEDVLPPINRDSNLYQRCRKESHDRYDLIKEYENIQMGQNKVCEDKIDLNETSQKRSRIEQLKILVEQHEASQSMRSFS